MGKGQAPGIATGLGVCGADDSEAGWAEGAEGAGRRLRTAGFFLAAFFLADFLVGFFLAALPDAALRGGFFPAVLPAAPPSGPDLFFAVPWRTGFFALPAVFFFFVFAPPRFAGTRLLTFLLLAMA